MNENEETYAVDMDYNPTIEMLNQYTHESLTASFIKFLKHKGLETYKAEAPVVIYEGTIVEIKSVKVNEGPMQEIFEELSNYLLEYNPKTILVYTFNEFYNFTQGVDESYVPVGEPYLSTRRMLRFGVIPND